MSLLSLLGGASGSPITTVAPQGVDLDGANDYFSRSSDLTGNVDSKTFTFSAWLYLADTTINGRIFQSGNNRISFYIGSSNLVFYVTDTAGATALSVSIPITRPSGAFTFHHILASFDMANNVGSKIYLDDILQTRTTSAFVNTILDFTDTQFTIGAYSDFSQKFKGRLSNVFLDYTYRDLSIEANRRLFIDANGKPADGWKALSPIIGMSMKDAATAHINDYGTGGNFTPNGTYATSNRGANQDNCTQLVLGGIDDYLSKVGMGGTNSKELTLSVNTKAKESATLSILSTRPITLQHIPASSKFSLIAYNSSNVAILNVDIPIPSTAINREYSLSLSIDLTSTSNRVVWLNGVDVSSSCTWTTYTNDTIEYAYTGTVSVGLTTDYQEIGELYIHNTYISTLSRFWDTIDNKPVSVRKVISDTGVTPIIASPIDASNPTLNYGSGGVWTANSAPYVGARGASEFWARSAKFDGTTGYLSKASTAIISTKLSVVMSIAVKNTTTASTQYIYNGRTNSNSSINMSSLEYLVFRFLNAAETDYVINASNITDGRDLNWTNPNVFYTVMLSVDLIAQTKSLYVNTVNQSTKLSIGTVSDVITITDGTTMRFAGLSDNSALFDNMISMCYFTTDYIDFSQEVNRLKFVDGLGYPLDLSKQIESGAIPTPLIYLPFDDTTNLGKNLGTGGNMTVNGTVTAGSDVLG